MNWWNLDTGSGAGGPIHFQDFCGGRSHKWLAWVYLVDHQNGLLLASSTSSAVPLELQNESGASPTSVAKAGKTTNKFMFERFNERSDKEAKSMTGMYEAANTYYQTLNKVETSKEEIESLKRQLEKPSVTQYVARLQDIAKTRAAVHESHLLSEEEKKIALDLARDEREELLNTMKGCRKRKRASGSVPPLPSSVDANDSTTNSHSYHTSNIEVDSLSS